MASSFPSDILVIDDEPVVLQVLSLALKSRALTVKTASTGEEGVGLLKNRGFGCVLTDKNLPGIDGIEVVRRLRAEQPFCAAIVMTGYASTASAVEALRLGADDYLEKPFQDLDLVALKVENAITGRRRAYERDQFAERIRKYDAELKRATATVDQQRTEIELFEDVLTLRVRAATEDLRQDLLRIQTALSRSADADYAIKVHAQSILDGLRALQVSAEPGADPFRSELARLTLRLETHLRLLEHLKPDGTPPPGASA